MVHGRGGMQKSLLTWPVLEMQFLYDLAQVNKQTSTRSAAGIQGGDLCQYLDSNLQGSEQGRMGPMH